MNIQPLMLIVDTIIKPGFKKNECEVEGVIDENGKESDCKFIIYTTFPLTKDQKIEAISKFKSTDLTLIF